jgi:hypothetical protein
MGAKVVDITGNVYKYWTAIRFVRTDHGQSVWEFRCVCGKISEEYAYIIKRGGKKSCGCIKGKDIAGMRFGRLIAIRNTGRQALCKKTYYWLCQCDCGNTTEVWVGNLMNGHTQSCGCYKMQRISESSTTHGMSGTPEYNRMRARLYKDKYRGLDDGWTYEMESSLIGFFDRCVICGSEDDLEIDHVFPKSKGYGLCPGNAIRLCHFHNCPSFKGGKMPDELPEFERNKILLAAKKFKDYWESITVN